jgi:hypothetical protein
MLLSFNLSLNALSAASQQGMDCSVGIEEKRCALSLLARPSDTRDTCKPDLTLRQDASESRLAPPLLLRLRLKPNKH